MSEILTQTTRTELPRFNGWRYMAMLTLLLSIPFFLFTALVFYELVNSPVPVSASWFTGGVTDKDTKRILLQVQSLQRDTALMGKRLRALQLAAPAVIEVQRGGELAKANFQALPPFPKKQSDYPTFCAWATDAMRYYRKGLADTYTALGITHQIPLQ